MLLNVLTDCGNKSWQCLLVRFCLENVHIQSFNKIYNRFQGSGFVHNPLVIWQDTTIWTYFKQIKQILAFMFTNTHILPLFVRLFLILYFDLCFNVVSPLEIARKEINHLFHLICFSESICTLIFFVLDLSIVGDVKLQFYIKWTETLWVVQYETFSLHVILHCLHKLLE